MMSDWQLHHNQTTFTTHECKVVKVGKAHLGLLGSLDVRVVGSCQFTVTWVAAADIAYRCEYDVDHNALHRLLL